MREYNKVYRDGKLLYEVKRWEKKARKEKARRLKGSTSVTRFGLQLDCVAHPTSMYLAFVGPRVVEQPRPTGETGARAAACPGTNDDCDEGDRDHDSS